MTSISGPRVHGSTTSFPYKKDKRRPTDVDVEIAHYARNMSLAWGAGTRHQGSYKATAQSWKPERETAESCLASSGWRERRLGFMILFLSFSMLTWQKEASSGSGELKLYA